MDISGRFYSYMDKGMIDHDDPANRKLHYTTAPYYNRIWGWYNQARVTDEIDEPLFRLNNPNQNRVFWQGAQGSYNPRSDGFDR